MACRTELNATVTEIHITADKHPQRWLTLRGTAPANGIIRFTDDTEVVDAASIGDQVTASVWHGKVLELVDGDIVSETAAAPTEEFGWPVVLGLATVVGLFLWLSEAAVRARPLASRAYGLGAILIGVAAGSLTTLTYPSSGAPLLVAAGAIAATVLVTPSAIPRRRPARRRRTRHPRPARPVARPVAARPRRFHLAGLPSMLFALAAVGAASLVVMVSVHSINLARTYRSAAPCPAWAPHSGCRGEVLETVQSVRIVDGSAGEQSIYLYGSTPEIGWVGFSHANLDFVQRIHAGDSVTAEWWSGRATAVTAGGQTAPTAQNPIGNRNTSLPGLIAALLFVVTALRLSSRNRLPEFGGFWPWQGPRRVVALDVATLLATAGGVWLLAAGVLWGVAVLSALAATLLYANAVPALWPIRRPPTITASRGSADARTA
jgi:hypothetical protein